MKYFVASLLLLFITACAQQEEGVIVTDPVTGEKKYVSFGD